MGHLAAYGLPIISSGDKISVYRDIVHTSTVAFSAFLEHYEGSWLIYGVGLSFSERVR